MRRCLWLVALALVIFCAGCANSKPEPPPRLSESHTSEKQPEQRPGLQRIRIDTVTLFVELAQDDEKRERGLMFRESLPENQGMLFIFDIEHRLSFWMRNTFVPLDIAFMDATGVIVDIQQMQPLDETRSYVSTFPALYAIEVNQGWFKRHGIEVGDRVIF
jgi:hypothetical protein